MRENAWQIEFMLISQIDFAFQCFYFPNEDNLREDYEIFKTNCLKLKKDIKIRRSRLLEEIEKLNELEAKCKWNNRPQDWKINSN